MDWGAPSPPDDALNTVELDDIAMPLIAEEYERLSTIEPLWNHQVLSYIFMLELWKFLIYKVIDSWL